MLDRDVFGVQNPVTGEVAYCAVLGRRGEVYALVVYLGTNGLEVHARIQSGELTCDDDVRFMQRCLMVSFEDRSAQEVPDLKIVKSLGLKFRGRNGWPLFRSYRPGYHPWTLNEAEVAFLTLALEQAVAICQRFKENPKLLTPPEEDQYLVRVQTPAFLWTDQWMKPVPLPPKTIPVPPVDEIALARLKSAVTRGCVAWEADLCYAPMPVAEKRGGRPYYPPTALLVDRESRYVLGTDMFGPTEDLGLSAPHLVESFLKAVAGMKAIPGTVVVCREEFAQALRPTVGKLGVKVEVTRRLPALESFRRELFERFG
jgi:antitoxin component of RelBE/YafQ-DinJ toxin-antitoxin module